MVEEFGGAFEGIREGEGGAAESAESVRESAERARAKAAAAAKRLKKIAKDEKQEKNWDQHLVKVLPGLLAQDMEFVMRLINWGVPSLTILAFLSLRYDHAFDVCHHEIQRFITTRGDFSRVGVDDGSEHRLGLWVSYCLAGNHLTTTTTLHEVLHEAGAVSTVEQYWVWSAEEYLKMRGQTEYSPEELRNTLAHYSPMLWEPIAGKEADPVGPPKLM